MIILCEEHSYFSFIFGLRFFKILFRDNYLMITTLGILFSSSRNVYNLTVWKSLNISLSIFCGKDKLDLSKNLFLSKISWLTSFWKYYYRKKLSAERNEVNVWAHSEWKTKNFSFYRSLLAGIALARPIFWSVMF